MAMSLGDILVSVRSDTSQLVSGFNRAESAVTKTTKNMTTAVKTFAAAYIGLNAIDLAQTLGRQADAMTNVNSKLKLVTTSTTQLLAVQKEIFNLSQDTRSSFTGNIELYQRMAMATKNLNLSQKDMVGLTKSINQAMTISGTTASGAQALVAQLGQAFSSNFQSVAQELGTIRDQAPRLYQAMLDGTGMTSAAFKKAAEDGKLSSDIIIKALQAQSTSVSKDFEKMVITIDGANQQIINSITTTIGKFDEMTGASKFVADEISKISKSVDNIDPEKLIEVAKQIGVVSATIGGTVIALKAYNTAIAISATATALYGGEMGFLNRAILLTTASTKALSLATKAVPYVAVAAGIYSIIEFLPRLTSETTLAEQAVNKYAKSIKGASDATLDFEATKITAEIARVSKLANEEAKKRGVNAPVSGYGETLAYELTALSKQLDILKKQKEEIKSKNMVAEEGAKKTTTKAEPTDKEIKAAEKAAEKAKKLEEDRLKKSHEIAQSQLKMIQDESDKKIKLQEDYYNTLNDIVQKNDSEKLDGLAKEAFDTFAHYDSLIEKYKEVAGAESALRAMQTMAIDTIIEKQKELDEAYNNKTAIDSLDEIYGRYSKLIDAQIELAENGMNIDFDFGDGAKELNNISKAMQQLHVGSLKYTKQDMKMQEDYAKAYLEAGDDTVKQAQLEADFDADNAAINKTRQSAEIAGYANLAGAIAGAFEEGSGAAKAFQAIQATLGIVNAYTSISQAMALPYPANIPATAAAIAAAMPLIGTLSSLGGSGGGGSVGVPTTSTGFTFDQNREQTEGTYEPMTDRLDRQIELLESIDRQGSASQLGIELASTSFERDTKIWVEDVLEKARQGMADSAMSADQTAAVDVQAQQATGLDIWKTSGSTIGYDESVLREGTNLIKTLIAMSEESLYTGTLYQAAALEAGYSWANMMTFVNIEIEKDINEYQNLVSEWALSVIDSMEDLKDAASDFKGYYDDITGSMFYETERLNQAFSDVDKLKGTNSFADYLKTSIDDIKALESFFTEDVFNLLMSNDPADIEAQIAAVDELGRVTGQTFDNGAKEALNYLESIELVAEAMTTSRENIESFIDSLKTSDQLAADMASTMGVELATTVEGLSGLFYKLSEDMDGLTDADLDLLNANVALLENTDEYQSQIDVLNESLTSVTSSIGTLDGALGTIESTIEKLRAASRTSEQSLQIYYDAIAEAQRLSTTDLYEDYAKAVSKASAATSALFETSNFTTSQDMQFAQLVAANQFEGLQDATLTEIDYLKQIEENTRDQILVLSEAMDNLGLSISQTLQELLAKYNASSTTDKAITKAYATVLDRSPDEAGADYWASDIAAGNVSTSNIGIAVGTAAVANQEISRADYVTKLYTEGLGKIPTAEEVDYWANQSLTSTTDLASLFSQLDPKFQSFAVGTPNVPYDMLANIHKGEAIVPASFADGIRGGDLTLGSNTEMMSSIQELTLEMKQNNEYLARIEYNTTKSRNEGVA